MFCLFKNKTVADFMNSFEFPDRAEPFGENAPFRHHKRNEISFPTPSATQSACYDNASGTVFHPLSSVSEAPSRTGTTEGILKNVDNKIPERKH